MRHTPTPWLATPKSPKTWRIGIYSTDGSLIAELPSTALTAPRKQADASLIVRAVNAHADLVAALEMLIAADADGTLDDSMFEVARLALAKAKGESA